MLDREPGTGNLIPFGKIHLHDETTFSDLTALPPWLKFDNTEFSELTGSSYTINDPGTTPGGITLTAPAGSGGKTCQLRTMKVDTTDPKLRALGITVDGWEVPLSTASNGGETRLGRIGFQNIVGSARSNGVAMHESSSDTYARVAGYGATGTVGTIENARMFWDSAEVGRNRRINYTFIWDLRDDSAHILMDDQVLYSRPIITPPARAKNVYALFSLTGITPAVPVTLNARQVKFDRWYD